MTAPVWPCYVINLADNTARMDSVRKQLDAQGLRFERIEAVNGWRLPPDEIARVYDARANARRAKANLVPAEIGCYLSHIAAWRAIAAGEDAGGIVLEDDFAAEPELSSVLEALCDIRSRDWDLVKLFCLGAAPSLSRTQELVAAYRLGRPFKVPSTTLGYAVTRAAAARLVARSLPFFRPIDEDHKFFWEHGLRISLVHPSPIRVGMQEAVTGTIGAARRKSAGTGLWRKLRYAAGYQARLRWHRLRGET